MAIFEDSVEEFKKLPKGGKIAVGALFLLVIGIALYERANSQNATSSGVSGATSPSTDLTGTSAQQGAMIGNVPVVPTGYSSLYNPTTGALEGYQPQPPPTPTPPTAPTPTPPKNPPISTTNPGFPKPLIPYSQTWSGNHYFPVSPGGVFSYQGSKYFITGNTNGYITGVQGATTAQQAAGKGQILLYAPKSAYGGGPMVVQHSGTNGATQVPSPRIDSGNEENTGIQLQGEWNGDAHRNRTIRDMMGGR